MSYIDLVTPEKARGPIAEAFAQFQETLGSVPSPLQMWAVSPGLFPVFTSTVGYFLGHQTLGQPLLAWIRYLVAERDACKYCIDFNKSFLVEQVGVNLEVVEAAREDPTTTPLPENEKALLLVVLKAVRDSLGVTAEEIEKVKAMGFSEQEVFDAVASGAFVAMDDILINTFKVE